MENLKFEGQDLFDLDALLNKIDPSIIADTDWLIELLGDKIEIEKAVIKEDPNIEKRNL